MESPSASGSDSDVEAAFYRILASIQDDTTQMLQSVKRDMFDATIGQQAGITTDGNVALMIVVNQPTAKMVLDAMRAVVDHKCQAGMDTVVSYMMYTASLLQGVLPQMNCEVQSTSFFPHEEGGHE